MPSQSRLSGRPDIFLGSKTLKKGAKYGVQRAGCIKQDHCYSKREEARLPLRLSGGPDIFLGLEPKKRVQNTYGVQNTGSIKQGHCYSKREEARLPLLNLNNNDPVFCTLLFALHILDPIFFRITGFPDHKTTHVFKTRIVGAD